MKTNANEISLLIENLIVKDSNFTNKSLLLNQDGLSADDIQRQADTLREANLWMWDEARGKFESLIYNVVLEIDQTTTDPDTGEITTEKKWNISDIINYKKGVLGFLTEQGTTNDDGSISPFLNPVYVRYWIDAMVRLAEFWFSNGFTISTEPNREISHEFADSSLHSVSVAKDDSGIYMPIDTIRALELGQFHIWKVQEEVWMSKAYYEEWVTRTEFNGLREEVSTLKSSIDRINQIIEDIKVGALESDLVTITDEELYTTSENLTQREHNKQVVEDLKRNDTEHAEFNTKFDQATLDLNSIKSDIFELQQKDGELSQDLQEKLSSADDSTTGNVLSTISWLNGDLVVDMLDDTGAQDITRITNKESKLSDDEKGQLAVRRKEFKDLGTAAGFLLEDGPKSSINHNATFLNVEQTLDDGTIENWLFNSDGLPDSVTREKNLTDIKTETASKVNRDGDTMNGVLYGAGTSEPTSFQNRTQIATMILQATPVSQRTIVTNQDANITAQTVKRTEIFTLGTNFPSNLAYIQLGDKTNFVSPGGDKFSTDTANDLASYNILIGGVQMDGVTGVANSYIKRSFTQSREQWGVEQTATINFFVYRADDTIEKGYTITLKGVVIDGKLNLGETAYLIVRPYNNQGKPQTPTFDGSVLLNDTTTTFDNQNVRVYLEKSQYVNYDTTNVNVPTFKDGIIVSDVNWADKSDKTYVDTELDKKVDEEKQMFIDGTNDFVFNYSKIGDTQYQIRIKDKNNVGTNIAALQWVKEADNTWDIRLLGSARNSGNSIIDKAYVDNALLAMRKNNKGVI